MPKCLVNIGFRASGEFLKRGTEIELSTAEAKELAAIKFVTILASSKSETGLTKPAKKTDKTNKRYKNRAMKSE